MAPDFEVKNQHGETVKLSAFRGQKVVLYFYPKDDTPGCTDEGKQFRDSYAQFQSANSEIYGVSRDTLPSHERFKAKMSFPFDLLSDPDERLCEMFGVMKMKNMYGKQVRGIERSTFVIDREGKLAREWRKVKVDGHAREVLEFVAKL